MQRSAPCESNQEFGERLNWNKMYLGCYSCTTLHHWQHMTSWVILCVPACVCVCCIWAWLTDWLKCCCVSAGVRGSPQSGAEGLRRRLDHCHQSAGGNPHLSAVSCATLEGKHTNADWDFFSAYRILANPLGFHCLLPASFGINNSLFFL